MESMIKDLLASVKRLNEECASRVEFEHKLLEVIDDDIKEIDRLQQNNSEYFARIRILEEELETLKEEASRFKEGAEKLCLKPDQSFVWNAEGELEIYEN